MRIRYVLPGVVLGIASFLLLWMWGRSRELQSLSGVLNAPPGKSTCRFSLDLDGATGSIDVNGDALASFQEGDRVLVKGAIKTVLVNPGADGSPTQVPVHWEVFMDVEEARRIRSPFGFEEE